MPTVAATAAVVLAALLAASWLAGVIERVAVAASGPVAGEPALAWAGGVVPGRPAAAAPRVGVAAAATGGVLAWVVGPQPVLPALVLLAGLGVVLAPVDVRTRRLPDALVLPAYPLLAIALLPGGLTPWARAIEGGLVAYCVLCLLAVATPSGFGFGDVKLTGLLGAALAWYGWPVLLRGLLAGFFYGGLCASALLVARRAGRRTNLAFGPFLLAGALTAVCTVG